MYHVFMYTTISARQIQREYKRLFEKANKEAKPIVVMSHNKPQGAIIGMDLLEMLQLNMVAEEALKEYRKGKTKSIADKKELDTYFAEIDSFVEL